MNICVFGAAREAVPQLYKDAAEQLGTAMARRGHTMVFGGGATGLMGSIARGMYAEGGEIIGIAPAFFDTPGVLWKQSGRLILTDTLDERKARMDELSDAYIALPGGLGTMDELFRIYTLRTLGKHEKPIALFSPGSYYDLLSAFLQKSADEEFMTQDSLSCAPVFADGDALLDYLQTH